MKRSALKGLVGGRGADRLLPARPDGARHIPVDALAEDADQPGAGSGFRGVTLAHNVRAKADVDATIAAAVAVGARAVKPAHDASWGGRSGYFADPDGHLWEVAWNPFFPLAADGAVSLPDLDAQAPNPWRDAGGVPISFSSCS